MTAPYFVEVLSRAREVRHRHRVESLPIHIGRGYDNDIILDDLHVAEHHVIVEQGDDGMVAVRDLGSRNGIVLGGRRSTMIPLDGSTVFQLGHTSLRIRSSGHRVDVEVPVSNFHRWEGWPPALAGIGLIVLISCTGIWVEDADRFEASTYAGLIATTLFIGMIWCGCWAFANRLFGESARLGRHFFILGCGLAVTEIFSYASGLAAYSLSLEMFTRYSSHAMIAILSVIVYFHLLHIKPNRARQCAMACIALSLLGSGVMLLYNYSSRGMLADELFMSVRYPPSMRLTSDRPLGRLLDDAARLKARVDRERARAVSEDETNGQGQE